MKIVYFAWLRERVGVPEEVIALPDGVRTVGDAITHLSGLGENYAYAFERPAIIRAALDRKHVSLETPLGEARELALFPPMTGG
ncbi:MAG: molybdopterin converting factor subunit 1 [Beijerinckiaceae bacterium]|nr:molybdopterin converting factor subunit 1 [Beijerinckiaceae bacterium]MCZ8301060.1 molybdopterin converting factor subunit 1 [Beijerinckiaceae bacterium]